MLLGARQPGYLPWLGFFAQVRTCDLYVIEDSLAYCKQSWHSRNRIRTGSTDGWTYLTVPVVKAPVGTSIADMLVSNATPWQRRHWQLIEANYARAPHFQRYAPYLEGFYLGRTFDKLIDVDLELIGFLLGEFGIHTPVRLLSSTGIQFDPAAKSHSLLRLMKATGADAFFEGPAGRDYLDPAEFGAAGCRLVFQEWEAREYRQQYPGFISHLSALDFLLNMGPDVGEWL